MKPFCCKRFWSPRLIQAHTLHKKSRKMNIHVVLQGVFCELHMSAGGNVAGSSWRAATCIQIYMSKYTQEENKHTCSDWGQIKEQGSATFKSKAFSVLSFTNYMSKDTKTETRIAQVINELYWKTTCWTKLVWYFLKWKNFNADISQRFWHIRTKEKTKLL